MPLDRTWSTFAKNWTDGVATFRIIQSSEYTADKSNAQTIRLVCSNGAGAHSLPSEPKGTKWIHLESSNLTLELLKTFVLRLDFLLPPALRRLAIQTIEDIRQTDPLKARSLDGTRPKLGDVLGRRSASSGSKTKGQDNAIFLSNPHLFAPGPLDSLPMKGVPSLLDSLYEYNIDNGIDSHSQAAQAGGIFVPQLWSLLLNSDTLITCSQLSFEKLCHGLVEMDMNQSTTDIRFTVTIVDPFERSFTLAVHPSSTYVDFLNDVLEMGTPHHDSVVPYELHDSSGSPVRPQQWIQLLKSKELEGQVFKIQRKPTELYSESEAADFDLWPESSVHQSGTSYRIRSMERDRSAMPYKAHVLKLVESATFKNKTADQVRHESRQVLMPMPPTLKESENDWQHKKGPNVFIADQSSDEEHFERVRENEPVNDFPRTGPQGSFSVKDKPFDSDYSRRHRHRSQSRRSSSVHSQRRLNKSQRTPSMVETSMLPVDKVSISVLREMGYDFTIEDDMYIFSFPVDLVSIHQLLNTTVHNIPNKIVKRPFFTWKSTASLSQVDVTAGVIKVLNRIIKLLLKERTSKLHQDGFTCTLADLQARQISSGVVGELSDVKKSFADGNGNDNGSQHGTVAEQSKIPSFSSEPNTSTQNNDSTVKDAPDSIHESSSDTSETSTTNDSQVTLVDARYGRLIEVTNLFLEDFIPGKGDATTHKLVQSLWGFVDAILRQLAAAPLRSRESKEWIIRKFPLAGNKLAFDKCKECTSKVTYAGCAAALDHLHLTHMQCSHEHDLKIPSEDPCFIWLSCIDEMPSMQTGDRVAIGIDNLVNNILEITARTHNLHCLVASSTPTKRKTLPLLSDLVYLFQDTVSMYAIVARELTYIVRADIQYPNGARCSRLASSLQMFRDKIMVNIRYLLDTAEAELLLGSKTREFDFVEAIGPEFLVAALSINLQNRPIDEDSPETSELYRQRLWHLRYQGTRRPDRRLHLNLNKFGDEIDALSALTKNQTRCLKDYLQLISPASSPVTAQDREINYRFEKLLINRQVRHLEDRDDRLSKLSREARRLKDEVRANIDILEEGHGKAIRVFTLVTLFFLPLSFVTSFLGMNTADIRDMDNDQRLFWAIGIPVTVVVFTVAFVYGYQSDALFDRIAAALEARQARRAALLKRRPTREDTMYSIRSMRSDDHKPSSESKRFGLWKRRGKNDTRNGVV